METYSQDDIYPNLGFKIWTEILKVNSEWRWKVWLHVIGPDDQLNKTSALFSSKKEATENLLLNLNKTITDLLNKSGE